MIKKLLTIAALALPLMAANAQESVEKVVFEEDFSLMTKGEVGAPADDIICEDGVIKSEYTHKAGWQATAAKSAGGSVYIPNDGSHTLLSPIINCGASIDGNVTIEFDAYYVDEAEAGGVYVWVRQPNATSDDSNQFRSQLIMNKAEQWVHITFSTTAASKPLSSLKDDKSLQVGIRSTYNAIYVKNLKVTINVDPNADVVESTDFAGTYTFKATKEITAPNAQDAKALWLQEEFEFTIAANEGDDVEVYPYVITGFPASFNPNTNAFVEYNALKAKPSSYGKSLVLTIGHAGKLQSGSDHPELAGPNGKDDTATELVISPIEGSNKYTIEGGFQVINHTEAFAIFPESKRNLAKFTDVVISPAVPDFTGAYNFTSTKTITAPNEQDAKALWVQNEFDFTITANEGDDAEVYPFLLNNFPTSKKDDGSIVAYNAIKAKPSADGKSLVLAIGHDGKLQSGSDHPELAGPAGYEDPATELVMSPIADSENYTIEGGFQVINHTEAFAIFPASWRNLAKLDDIVITRTGDVDGIDEIVVDEVEKAEKKALEGVYTINGAKVRNTNDATGLQPGFYIIGGEKVIIR